MVAVRQRIRIEGRQPGQASEQALPRPLEAAVAILIGLGCLAARLVNLDRYTGSYPEGVRAEQLLLMALGFRPFRDIFSDQGPWLLDALYPGVAVFGPTLVGVRAAPGAAGPGHGWPSRRWPSACSTWWGSRPCSAATVG